MLRSIHLLLRASEIKEPLKSPALSSMREKATDNLEHLNIFKYNTLLIIDYLYLFDNFIGM